MYTKKYGFGYWVMSGDWKVNGPFDNEQDAQEYIDDLNHELDQEEYSPSYCYLYRE